MDDTAMRHGCLIVSALGPLLFAATGVAVPPPCADQIPRTSAHELTLDYTVNEDAYPLRRVELWSTYDGGTTWQDCGRDEDLIPPMTFSPTREGLCGLCFIITNDTGACSTPPDVNTEPHLWLLVDHTAPIAQLHAPEFVHRAGDRSAIQLRWTAVDDHLPPRPIDLSYRKVPDGEWMSIALRLPNSGRYDWRLPPELDGQIMFRLAVQDESGNRSHSATSAVSLEPENGDVLTPADAVERVPTPNEQHRARELLRLGRRHQLRNEHDLAAARLRDALKLDPQQPEALVKLGVSMYALARYEESAHAFELAIRQEPLEREALVGLAQTLLALRKYEAAESKLLAIVEQYPKDVDIWLRLGDVAVLGGDEVSAREYYMKAVTEHPEELAVVARAKARLQELPTLHRTPANEWAP